MSARLYDRDAKVWVEVPDERVTELVGKGTHGFAMGHDVPVVSPDGKLGTIPSSQAEDAFRKGGFRWRTADDSRAWEERGQRDIMQQQYGENNLINATAAGFLRGQVPGADYAMIKMGQGVGAVAGALGIDKYADAGQDVQTGLRELKTQNPTASMLGEVAGLVAPTSVIGGVANKVGKGVEGLVAADIAGGAVSMGVKRVLEKGLSKAMGEGAVGAIMGLNTGLSEAALGDPRELGEVLFDHTLSGAIWGAAAGGALGSAGGAAPYVKSGVKALAGITGDALSDAAGAVFNKTVPAVLSAAGEKELAGIVSGLSGEGSLVAREAYFKGGKPLAEKVAAKVREAEGRVAKEARVTRQGLDNAMKKEPRAVREQVNALVDSHAGQIETALEEAWSTVQGHTTQLDAAIAEGAGQPAIYGAVDDAVESTIRALEKDKTPRSKIIAAKLSKYINGQRAANGVRREAGEVIPGVLNEGGEVQIALELRRTAMKELEGATNKKPLENFIQTLTDHLQGHPTYGSMIRQADEAHAAFDGLRRFVTGAEDVGNRVVKSKILQRIQNNPEFRAAFQTVADHFSDLMPEFAAIREAVTDTGKLERVRAFQDKVEALQQGGLRRLSTDEIISLSDEFGKKDWLKQAERLKELQTALSTEGTGSLDRYVRLKEALGEPVEDLAKQLAPHAATFDAIQQLEKAAGEKASPSWVRKLIVGGVKQAAFAVGGKPGLIIGNMVEGMANGASRSVTAAGALETLTRVQLAARKNTERVAKATNAVIDALTSKATARVAVAGMSTARASFAEARENYKNTTARLEFLGDIENRIETVTNALHGLEHAPQLQAALSTQFGQVVDFITSKMPRDPLASKGFLGHGASSSWEPSDFELAKFQRYTAAAQDPVVTLTRIASGDVTPEEVETLQTLYPKIYERLQGRVMDAIMDPKVKLTYAQRIQIGTVLKIAADATLDPQFMATMQAPFAVDQGGRPPQGGGGGFSGGGASGNFRPGSLDINTQAMSSNVSRISEK